MDDLSNIKITRARRRTMAVQVLPDGTVEVKAPRLMPKFLINKFINDNLDWIKTRKEQVSKTKKHVKKYVEGEAFRFFGKEYTLQLGNYTQIQIQNDKLLFPVALKFRIKKEIENWYIKQAKKIITDTTNTYAVRMNTRFESVRLSDTRSKWGSCTHDNRLQFNWRLVIAPLIVLRYVVIHELAHTIEKNHSRAFWSKVASQNPSYREQRKWLKNNGDSLWV